MPSTLAAYYGPPTPAAVAALGGWDMVVVQTTLYAPEQLLALRKGGTRVLGYLSVGEDHALGDRACEPFGEPYHAAVNPAWGSVVVDAAHPQWARTLLARAAASVAHADGLLLDTLDSAEPGATLARVRDVRAAFPQATLVANRGFGLLPELAPLLRPHGGGVLFEALSTTHAPAYAAHDAGGLAYTAGQLAEVRRLELPVWALDYADTPQLAAWARARAATLGLGTFVTDRPLCRAGGFP